MEKGNVAIKEPAKIDLEAGKTYLWCACGLSGEQPFCDGSHKGTAFKPKLLKVEESHSAWICQCKQTDNVPYCDGSHRYLYK